MIFVDGVGIGENDPAKNPFFRKDYKFLKEYFGDIPHLQNQHLYNDNAYLFPVDACMDVEDIPQSGTGQTAIFCGVNAPKINGKHFGPFPPSSVVPIIKDQNILGLLNKKRKKVFFANAYPQIFFDYVNSGRQRLSVTTLSCLLSGIKLNDETDLRAGNALTAEIDNKRWNEKLNYNLELITPENAAKRLIRLSGQNDFTLFEFFFTDHLGHWRIKDEFEHITDNFDRFLFTILNEIESHTDLIICSDHGNFEDLSVKHHTLNPAMTITKGPNAKIFSEKIKSLYDIHPQILKLF